MIADFIARILGRITPETSTYDPAEDEFVQYLEKHREASTREVERIQAANPDSFLDGVFLPDFPPRGRRRRNNEAH